MKTATVGGRGSQLHGLRTRCCQTKTRTGQVVSWALTKGAPRSSWRERAFVLHVTCMKRIVEDAPEGAPGRACDIQDELASLRELATAT